MKRLLILLLTACSSNVAPAPHLNIPKGAYDVQGARAALSFGVWQMVNEEGAGNAYRFALKGSSGTTKVDCQARELVAGRTGVFVQASLADPILVCDLERDGLRSVLGLTRDGKGELRQIHGTTYDVRALPLGFDIGRDQLPFAVIETVKPGRVWIDPEAPNKDDLAAASAALLLFHDLD